MEGNERTIEMEKNQHDTTIGDGTDDHDVNPQHEAVPESSPLPQPEVDLLDLSSLAVTAQTHAAKNGDPLNDTTRTSIHETPPPKQPGEKSASTLGASDESKTTEPENTPIPAETFMSENPITNGETLSPETATLVEAPLQAEATTTFTTTLKEAPSATSPLDPAASTTRETPQSSNNIAQQELEHTKAINIELERQNKTLREQLKTLQQQFDRQLSARKQAECESSDLHGTIQQLQEELSTCQASLTTAQTQTTDSRQHQARLEQELEQLRVEYEEHQQSKMALEVKLNEIKKVEAAEANLVESYEEDLKAAFDDLEATREELEQLKRNHANAQQHLQFAEQRLEEQKTYYESVVKDEKKKNEQRKAKMKAFVEKKTEELRQSKEDCDSLQNEIAQTNQSLLDMDKRWKQLHSQWAQAQTRNRELQRDLNRIKKDSENLHKQGDTLEMKLSRSANETEEHKTKRLAAKHELISVLRTLDAERDSTLRLCQRVKFTVAPRILQQQQMLDESSNELDGAVNRLALRFGKQISDSHHDDENNEQRPRENGSSDSVAMHVDGTSNAEFLTVVEKLDDETKRVSLVAALVAERVEKLRRLIDNSLGDRSCFTVLSELVTTGTVTTSPAALQNHAHTIASVLPAIRGARTQGYGQVPRASEHS